MSLDEWVEVLRDAPRIKTGMRTSLAADVRWLFYRKLLDWAESIGAPVEVARPVPRRLRMADAMIFPGDFLSYETGDSGTGAEVLDPDFCLRYGFDDYSHNALNYRHRHLATSLPASYVATGPKTLGNFAVALKRKPIGSVHSFPEGLMACGAAEIPWGKTRSVQAWLGVWFERSKVGPDLLADIEDLPDTDAIQLPADGRRRHSFGSPYASTFMQYYGRYGDDEATLRNTLGFKPKGSLGISEEILYRSACEIFGVDLVRRRYRGKELDGLEIDVWVESRRIGFEYQGEQHFRRIAHWHGTHGFEDQKKRDAKKAALCVSLGYRIVWLEPGSDLSRVALVRELRARNWLEPEFD